MSEWHARTKGTRGDRRACGRVWGERRGSSTAALGGLQVPARELGECTGCWLWGQAMVLGAGGGSGHQAEALGHEQHCWAVGRGAGW